MKNNLDNGICPVCKYDKLTKQEDCSVLYEFNPITKTWDQQELLFDDIIDGEIMYKCDNCEGIWFK
ncbi:hypothetical protein [Serratia sp. (in: enterobacteria)]|uniref:hypothetical protein n=1 Tax=Serratia sp. (in: enterobacteria) TaxID=616 RepID=UPI003989B4F3